MKAEIRTRIEMRDRIPLKELVPLDVPLTIFVDPSDACNFRCRFCPTGDKHLMKKVGRKPGIMYIDVFKKIVDDICEFEKPIKVLRLYKDGEPLMNPWFAEMVRYAKESGCCEKVDTTTNASMLTHKKSIEIIDAGLDKINISIEGINKEQYLSFAGRSIDFNKLVENIKFFYDNRKQCEMFIKINGDCLSDEDKNEFFEIFGDITDGINIEHTMNCWNEFEMDDMKQNNEVGIYGQPIKEVQVCPYVFYSISINSDGSVSACFLDWNRKLLIGDVLEESVKDIWKGNKLAKYQVKFLMKRRNEVPICRNCSQLSHGQPEDLDGVTGDLLLKWCKKNELPNM